MVVCNALCEWRRARNCCVKRTNKQNKESMKSCAEQATADSHPLEDEGIRNAICDAINTTPDRTCVPART